MPLPENHNKPSTKHHTTDQRFATILTEDFGIPTATVLHALEGEPQKAAISICEWAFEKTDDPARALVAWAQRHGRGAYRVPSVARDGTREQQDERRRGTAPARRRGVFGALDPARIRANVQRMAG